MAGKRNLPVPLPELLHANLLYSTWYGTPAGNNIVNKSTLPQYNQNTFTRFEFSSLQYLTKKHILKIVKKVKKYKPQLELVH